MFGCFVGIEADRDRSHRGVEHRAILRELLHGLFRERQRLGRSSVADHYRLDLDALLGHALVVRGRLGDRADNLQPLAHAPECRVLAGERRLIAHADEELCARAIGIARTDDGRNRSRGERLRARLGSKHAETAGAVLALLRRILRERIASLHDAVSNDAMERRARIGALGRKLDEVADVVRREIRTEIDHEHPGRRLDDRLLVGHLRRGQRRLERRGTTRRRLSGKRDDQQRKEEDANHLSARAIAASASGPMIA